MIPSRDPFGPVYRSNQSTATTIPAGELFKQIFLEHHQIVGMG